MIWQGVGAVRASSARPSARAPVHTWPHNLSSCETKSLGGGEVLGEPERSDEQAKAQPLTYEPNPKHKPIPSPGRHGSICPPHANGLLLLAQSDLIGQKRYATDGESAYCAQQHEPNKWHGYPVDWEEVPPRLKSEWVAADKVKRKTIRGASRRRQR